jgi:hypothetical protein
MTLWAKLIATLAGLIRSFMDYVEARRNEELGELREKERQRESDDAIRDAIDRAKPDSVSDDEAFGALGSDNDLLRAFKGGPAGRSDS